MQTQNLQVDAVSTINYQFTAIPTNFIYLMDNDCFKLFSILLQKETYWNNKGKLNNGYFIKSITELSDELGLTNRKDVHTIIEALYIRNIIDVVVEPRKFKTAKFKLNWEIINSYLDKSIYDLLEFEDKITKLNRNSNITYKDNVTANVTSNVTNNVTKCNTTIDNINNINKKENIYNNNINKEYINNIYKEKIEVIETSISEIEENNEEVGFSTNPTSNKEENNNTFQLCEVGMLEEKENTTSTVKEKFEKNFNDLLDRLGDNCSSVSELDNKVTLLCNWVENHNTDYSKEERETILNQLVDRYTEVKEILETNINELDVIFTDFCTIKEEEPIVEEKKTTTKEELIKNLQAFQESLVTYDNLEDAKHQLHFYCNKEDKLIREYELTSMVGEILNEINLQIDANKAFLTTFNLQGKETYYNEEIMQENALKSISYKVDDTEDYPF